MKFLLETAILYSLAIITIKGLPINDESESVETFKSRMEATIAEMPDQQQLGALKVHGDWYGKALKFEQKLKTNNKTLHEQVTYFIELLSLSMVRNRIIDVETRFGVGAMEPDELLKYLNQSKSDLKNITAIFRACLQEWRNVVDANGIQKVHDKLTKGKQVVVDELQSVLEGIEDERMSETVPIKAAKHFMRCKSIFYLYPDGNDVKKMREFIDQKFQGNIEEACREVGYIVVKTSTIGVHMLPPGFPRRVTPEMIKEGFKRFQMADENTLNAVDLLYCSQVKSDGA